MKKKTYHRTLQLATVVKKQYPKKKIKFLKEEYHLMVIVGSVAYIWAH